MNPSDLNLPPKFSSFRREVKQLETINTIALSSKRFTLLCAPPGVGKSTIAIAVAQARAWRTFYAVVTKSLSAQLMSDFADPDTTNLFEINGHSNYPCAIKSYDDSGSYSDMQCRADQGRRAADILNNGSNCGYKQDVEIATNRMLVTSNYAHHFQLHKSADDNRLGMFDLLVIDEAHKVHDILCEHASIYLSRHILSRFGIENVVSHLSTLDLQPTDTKALILWANRSSDYLSEELDNMRHEYAQKDLLPIRYLLSSLDRIIHEIPNDPIAWRILPTEKGITRISPLWGRLHAESYLFRSIPRILLISATLSKQTASDFGIPPSEYDYLEVSSSFPIKRRPFIFIPTVKVDFNLHSSPGTMRILMSRIDSIIADRQDRKGIIHSISYDWAELIKSQSKFSHLITTHARGLQGREEIDRFKRSSRPGVLISPIVEEGHDFKDDLARYQIILKIPRIDSREILTKARSQTDKQYLNQLIIDRLEQMYGRIIRSVDDWGETFILDLHWLGIRKVGRFHRWFRLAWQTMDSPPEPISP